MLPVGQWVQYNVGPQDPRAPLPSLAEQTIGIIRSSYTSQGKPYYNVVWNPGEAYPKSALYTEEQLCALDPQAANEIKNQLAAGTYTPSLSGSPGSQYVQPDIPTLALPPQLQGGSFAPGAPDQDNPTLTGPIP